MGPFGTRLGTVLGSRLGTKWPNDAVSAPAFSGVIDAMIAAGGAAPRRAGCISHRLYTAYTGALCRVRRAGDNAEANIPYDVATDRLDEASLAAHCTTNDGFVVTLYDQSGNALDITNATAAQQPKIYDGATQLTLVQGSLPWPAFVTASAHRWARADALGASGGTALTIAYFGASAATGARRQIVSVGPTGVNEFYAGVEATSHDPINGVPSSSRRNFNGDLTVASSVVHRIAAGANVSTSSCRVDGVELAEVSVVPGVLNISNTAYTVGSSANGTSAWTGGLCFDFCDTTNITGAPLAALEAFGAQLKALT